MGIAPNPIFCVLFLWMSSFMKFDVFCYNGLPLTDFPILSLAFIEGLPYIEGFSIFGLELVLQAVVIRMDGLISSFRRFYIAFNSD